MGQGIFVAQPGFDVRTCPDWAFLFNSDWPSLAIAYETTINNPAVSAAISHNLGYPPLAMVYGAYSGLLSYGRQAQSFSVTKTGLTIFDVTTAATLTIRLYNIDISAEQSYPLPQSAQAKMAYNSQFGIKQAKDGRPITSNDLNDFIIHSRSQSPAVLAVATEKGKYFTASNPGSAYSGPYIVFPLQTSYVPWVYAASSSDGVTYAFQTLNAVQLINNQLVYALEGGSFGSLIVLRDPLFYPNAVSVVY